MKQEDVYQKAAIESVRFMGSHSSMEVSIMTVRKSYEVGYRHGYVQARIDMQKELGHEQAKEK